MKHLSHWFGHWLPLLLVGAVLAICYGMTLQTIPNGSDHYFMVDVGETQIVLNTWGTLHATGYPHYVITGNLLAGLFRLIGADAATAPALVSLVWGALALALLYVLLVHLSGERWLAALVVLLFGLTRTVWIHQVIAEIYTFGLLLLVMLLTLALWRAPLRGRLEWLALIGGIGVAHHRALVMVAPALLIAVWGELIASPRRLPLRLVRLLLLGLAGFVPYLYLPLRAAAGADWVYGEPGTWPGFWDQFWGREAAQYIGAPATFIDLLTNAGRVTGVLLTDVTLPGLVVGLAGLLLGLTQPRYRRAALTLLISAMTAYLFHVVYYTDILSALILPVTLSLAVGWLFAAAWVTTTVQMRLSPLWWVAVYTATFGAALLFAVALIGRNSDFIYDLTTDPTGLETIAVVENTPPGSTLMIAWGHHHFAVGFARDVLGILPDITLVDHKANFRAVDQPLVTPEFTFYQRPVEWWQRQLGTSLYLRAAAPYLVEIASEPVQRDLVADTIIAADTTITCTPDTIHLAVDWYTPAPPNTDLSVFVHLRDADGTLVAQADQSAPVYGWRPLTTWTAGEVVHDIYPLPRHPAGATIRYGLYRQLPTGEFEHVVEYDEPVACAG